jgi:hypothetical protein
VAPISWWIRRDVAQGRIHLNFSRWSEYSLLVRQRKLAAIANQVRDEEMLLREYVLMHSKARLSPADRDAIFRWTQAERTRLIDAAYDLKKLRGKKIVQRIGQTPRYESLPKGVRAMVGWWC